ncbi:DUF805 domain-containing protein [Pseudokordiimonas caeni]|uniref:DUF805 domain-containing protein n=1 Tax=Pseudokordiimonas caeni TaxID=2997908 RepID=UPI00281190B5|nr:DUF805 domain-containing protein [Pseudokordiimonas caeni]
MDFKTSLQTCFNKFLVIEGRARRSEAWWFYLFCFVAGIVLSLVSSALHWLFSLATLVPSITVGVRRLQDTGKSGWWLLLALVPVVGWIAVIILLALPGTPGPNEYGEDPTLAA